MKKTMMVAKIFLRVAPFIPPSPSPLPQRGEGNFLRVAPHGTRTGQKNLQPSPRGCDGETPSCTGPCGGRTRSSLRLASFSLHPRRCGDEGHGYQHQDRRQRVYLRRHRRLQHAIHLDRQSRRADARREKADDERSEEHTSELQSRQYLVCRLLLEKKNRRICDSIDVSSCKLNVHFHPSDMRLL